ncbi:hypothetical protein DBV05_g10544 [Lasiodiplodia theobromae]|uniref:Uncharacterized protein n=1 Tax=Lasiodiplodia theobromae TaxID=45133 RepID=A0A5N5CZL1_9PEZI|nr:hypothetical protein DBV05_g10544 [Lasiodiplodia theobromae]
MISEYTAEFMEGVEFAMSPCEMEGVEFSSSSGPMEGIELTSESSSSVSPQVYVEDLASSNQDVHMEDVFLTDKLPAETSGAEKSPVMFKSLRPGPDGKLLKRPYQDELEYAMDRIKRRRIDNDVVLVCLNPVTAKSLLALHNAQQASSAGVPASSTSVAPPSGSGPGLASGVPSGTQEQTTAAQVAPAPASAPVQTPQPSSCAASSDLRTAQSDDVPAGLPQPAMETGLAPVVSTTTTTSTTTTDNDETSCVSSAPAAAPAPAVPMQDASAVVAPVVASSAGSSSVTDVAMTGDSAVSTARLPLPAASHEVEMSVPAGGSSEWDVEIDGSVCAEWMLDAEVAFGAEVDGGSSAGDVEMGSSSAPAACNRPTTTGPSSAASFGSSTVSFSCSASSASSRLFSSVAASSSVSSSAFSAGSSTSSFSLSRPAQEKKSAGSSDATAVSSTSSAVLPAPPPVAPSVLAGAFLDDLANDISLGAPTISGNLSTLGADVPAAGKTKTVENPATTDEAMEESSPEDPDLPDYESLQEDDLPDYESVQGDFPNEAATLTVTDDAPATDNAVTDADADAADADADDDDAVDDDGDAVDSPPALPASYSIPTTSYDFTMFRRLGRRIPHPEWLPELEKMCDSLAKGWKYDLGVRDNWEATKDAAHDKDRTPGSFDQECRYFGTAVMAYAKRLEGEQREREAREAAAAAAQE